MSQHVPDDLLASFVDGDIGEQLAVHIAGHLDECPSCGTRAAGLEPLAAAFAAVDDPDAPADLADAVLATLSEPERDPLLEIALGAGLLSAAALLAVVFGNPVGMAADLGRVLHVMGMTGRALASGLGPSSFVLSACTLAALAGCFFTARVASPLAAAVPRRIS